MNEETRQKRKMILGFLIYAIVILLIVVLANVDRLNEILGKVLSVLSPILLGLAIAYICNPFFRLFEYKLFCRLRPPALRRTISLICAYLTLILILALVVMLILPQFIQSFSAFIGSFDSYLATGVAKANVAIEKINSLFGRFVDDGELFRPIDQAETLERIKEIFKSGSAPADATQGTLLDFSPSNIISALSGTVSVIADLFIAFFISLYLLATKEKRYVQVMKIRRALFSDRINGRITRICTVADRSFGGFLEGKIIDSLIIGILTYIVLRIVSIPYPELIATFIGVANIIPMVGPIIGAIPTSLIILLADPAKVIPFLIIVFIIQQLDGNVIGPKILGSNTGVSSLCVVIAISTMGALWGFLGTVLGVPLFATILDLSDRLLSERLQKKGRPAGLQNYYAVDAAVNPFSDSGPTGTNRSVQRLEGQVLHIREKIRHSGEKSLTRKERWRLSFYNRAIRLHLIAPLSDEALVTFAAANAQQEAEEECRTLVQNIHSNPTGV